MNFEWWPTTPDGKASPLAPCDNRGIFVWQMAEATDKATFSMLGVCKCRRVLTATDIVIRDDTEVTLGHAEAICGGCQRCYSFTVTENAWSRVLD